MSHQDWCIKRALEQAATFATLSSHQWNNTVMLPALQRKKEIIEGLCRLIKKTKSKQTKHPQTNKQTPNQLPAHPPKPKNPPNLPHNILTKGNMANQKQTQGLISLRRSKLLEAPLCSYFFFFPLLLYYPYPFQSFPCTFFLLLEVLSKTVDSTEALCIRSYV